ncbi:MAG TPA: carotenoid biosynthesis protein [Gemmatimonadaceae bacterium]|nr:carotenoid biosynthesis protein [Gemmatimonadaceae bacterium]
MHLSQRALPRVTYAMLALFVVVCAIRGVGETTLSIVGGTVILFALCLTSAMHILEGKATAILLAVAVPFGWFAEEMGSTRGWFFGSYRYTDVMGPKLGSVPLVVPLGWFSLSYIGYLMANLIVHRMPVVQVSNTVRRFWVSLLAAFIVTAYDLGADPYMINVTHAWVMKETNGYYFGETVHGLVGWVTVTFIIVLTYRTIAGRTNAIPATCNWVRRDALIPVVAYGSLMALFVARGMPVETRSIVVFAMGIPILASLAGYEHWKDTSFKQGAAGVVADQ